MTNWVNTKQLFVSPLNVRKTVTLDDEQGKELVQSVKTDGVHTALIVRKTGEKIKLDGKDVDRFEIIDGQRRYLAACAAGVEKVPYELTLEKDPAILIRRSYAANEHRSPLVATDKARMVRDLMALKDDKNEATRFKSQSDVAVFLEVSPSRVSSWLTIDQVPESVKKLAHAETLTHKAVEKIAQGFVDEPDKQIKVAELAAEFDGQRDQVDVVLAVREDPTLLEVEPEARKEKLAKAVNEQRKKRVEKESKDLYAQMPEARPKARIADREREELIKKCRLVGREDYIEEIEKMHPEKGLSAFLTIKELIEKDLAAQVEAEQKKLKDAEAERVAQIQPNMDAVAAAKSMTPQPITDATSLVTIEELDAAKSILSRFVIEAELEDNSVVTLNPNDAPALEPVLIRLLAVELRRTGRLDTLIAKQSRRITVEDRPAEESHAIAEGSAGFG